MVLIIILMVGGSLVYDFTKKPPEPSKYSIRLLTHSDHVEKMGHFNSNLINILSPFLYGYLIRPENEVILIENDILTVKVFYKIDTGESIIWSTDSMNYFIKVDDNKYDFLKNILNLLIYNFISA